MSAPSAPRREGGVSGRWLASGAAKREDRHVSFRSEVRLWSQSIEHPEILLYTRIRKSPFFYASRRHGVAISSLVAMKEGWWSNGCWGCWLEVLGRWSGGERRSCRYRPAASGSGEMGGSLRRRIFQRERSGRSTKPAPPGAKGSVRVIICQIVSVSLRERSIWATVGPRRRPKRRLVRW